ncbi:uncharacterized protein [Temnothorax nylanderi]|uniref:uncharacterized protein isoform X2 n=1 Tax=Temnothorax nylanderi TaxID=102681 RepID=UPI003A8B4160
MCDYCDCAAEQHRHSGQPLPLIFSLLKRKVPYDQHGDMHEVLVQGSGLTRDAEMHKTSELSSSVPAFLAKLWKMVEDPKTNNLISWSSNGRSFFIRNQSKFTSELLPYYYKHNNMASFIRQLNMYGFHKKVSVELGGLKCDKDEIEFAHQYFCKEHPYLLEHIKRKVASNKNQDAAHPAIKPELVSKMIAEVRNMKGRQENMDSTINEMKLENATLWRELALLRQKHIKQQQIINKLIQFLVTLVQPSRSGLSVKRRYPLMINDSGRSHKQSKLSKSEQCPMGGPVIHEVIDTSDVDSDYIAAELLENETPTVKSPEEHIEIPTDAEDIETVQLHKNFAKNPKIETKKKRVCKGKKKRKNKVPIRILIPSTENGEKPREELHMLEISDEDEPVTFVKNESIGSKPIPMRTMRSSKLAAMAANIKSQEADNDTDMDNPVELEDNMEALANNASMKLHDILIVPEILNDSSIQNYIENTEDDNSNPNKINEKLNQIGGGRSVLVTSNNEQCNENRTIKSLQTENNSYDGASPSSSKDLSVSRVNPSGKTDDNYREEMGNHVEHIQNNLKQIHSELNDALRNEKTCSIDASTLLELLNAQDPTFGLPTNPELNLDCGKEDDDYIIPDSVNESAGSLMAYDPSTCNLNLYDFDDEMLLGNTSLSNPPDLQMNNLYTSDIDMGDTKVSLLDALVTNNMNAKS